MSIVELNASSVNHALQTSQLDVSVGESGMMDEPEINDLLEIARFSMDPGCLTQSIKRRLIKTQEDVDDVLALLTNNRPSSTSGSQYPSSDSNTIVTLF